MDVSLYKSTNAAKPLLSDFLSFANNGIWILVYDFVSSTKISTLNKDKIWMMPISWNSMSKNPWQTVRI